MKKKSSAPAKKKAAAGSPVSATVKNHAARSKPSVAIAVVALLINILLLPGLGTIIGGKIKHGLVQLLLLYFGGIILAFLGFFLVIFSPILGMIIAMLGSLMALSGWVWAIISGVFLIKEASS